MKNLTLLLLLSICLFSSCAVQHESLPTLNLAQFEYHTNLKDSLQYGHFENLLELSDNKRIKRWAKRKNYQIFGFNVINTSSNFRKGYQLKFHSNGKRLQLVRNEWVAEKARQKGTSSSIIAIPFYFLEMALFYKDESKEVDEYGFSTFDNSDMKTIQAFEQDKQIRKKANIDLKKDLKKHDISHQTLPFGVPVYGIIIVDSKEPVKEIQICL